ncbi:MAG: DNA mismatch repair endonuclease MutL [Endomicrobium sp.]|jgi:DNA mismatch repair protein MutL|nr:DNA mismatch repair endonuclease MutL [Endomicrobium sp.]
MAITVLSQETINKIAAGEVVERPLNVVKELVENSLDACATSINIEILQAGKKLIRISDNGMGMDEEDLKLSILRHATSKIINFEDLSHIQSMGFRGEALSSIAAVSKLEIKTKKRDSANGWKLYCEGGKNINITPWSGAQGTICEVKDLFFNTPARQKFLKSDSTERARIINTIEEIALANQEISFKLSFDNKTILQSSAVPDSVVRNSSQNPKGHAVAQAKADAKLNRISDILGKDFSNILKNTQIDHPKASFDIFFTGRDNAQPNRKYQYLFINSRPVNLPKWLIHCINHAYQGLIMHDRYPGFLIYITIDPSDIDINIHPTKREVKFADENAMYDIIFKSLKAALTSQPHSEISINAQSETIKSFQFDNKAAAAPIKSGSDFSAPNYISEPKKSYGSFKQDYSIKDYANVYVKQNELNTGDFDNNIKVLGQVFANYIIVENEGQLYIFDQHAAAERVKYEQYIKQTTNKKMDIQALLIPENLELSPSLSALLKENLSLINELGLGIEEFGDNIFRIKSYPALLGNVSIENIARTLLEDLETDKNIEIDKKREKIIRSACRASIKAGYTISTIEAKQLIMNLFKCESPFTCPHGRPTAYRISKEELEKFFKRV